MKLMPGPGLSVAILAAVLSVSPLVAQTPAQVDFCNLRDNAPADMKISGCTAVILSGELTGKSLGVVFNLRGQAYASKRELDHAIEDYDQAIRLYPQFVEAFINRGKANSLIGKDERALNDYAKAIEFAPYNATAWAYQGDVYYHAGQPEQAIRSFAESIKRSPQWMWPYNDRGELYLDRDDYELAIQDFDQVIKWGPTYPMGWNNRCRALAIVGRLEQALRDCNEAIKRNPKFINRMVKSGAVSAIEDRGLVHLKAGRLDLAIDDLNKAFQLTPRSAEVLYSLGIAKLKNGDTAGGNSDITAAKGIQADIGEKLANYGVK
jgi:tetratricopeptide (TPR) repeat protein